MIMLQEQGNAVLYILHLTLRTLKPYNGVTTIDTATRNLKPQQTTTGRTAFAQALYATARCTTAVYAELVLSLIHI